MSNIDSKLEKKILEDWSKIADRAAESIKRFTNTPGDYVMLPFVGNGVYDKTARWNIKERRFDVIIVPIWDGEDVNRVHIEIPYEKPLTQEEQLCATIKDRISIVIQEELGKNFSPILGQRIANMACDTIDDIVNNHRK